jgi:hypothetical protein
LSMFGLADFHTQCTHIPVWRRWHNHPEVGTMKAVMKFIRARRPRSFLLENVLGISDSAEATEVSPLDVLMKELTSDGYHVHCMSLNTLTWINCPRARPDLSTQR